MVSDLFGESFFEGSSSTNARVQTLIVRIVRTKLSGLTLSYKSQFHMFGILRELLIQFAVVLSY